MRAFPVWLAAAVLAGCTSFPEYEVRAIELPPELSWLQPGSTDESAVRERLGAPAQRHEDGRIQTWALTPQFTRDEFAEAGIAPACSLVLVFDTERRVRRASLVRLW